MHLVSNLGVGIYRMLLVIFALLVSNAVAVKLVPATRFMGIVDPEHSHLSKEACKGPFKFPEPDKQTALLRNICLAVQAEKQMLLQAGALARAHENDPPIFNKDDVDYMCESFHRWSRNGAVFFNAAAEGIHELVQDLFKLKPRKAAAEELATMLIESIQKIVEEIVVPDVSKWCGPDEYAIGLSS
jgi:hypothetical protein